MILQNLITTFEPYVIKSAIKRSSKAYDLDPSIIYGICQTESAMNSYAMRYEPGFYRRYIEKNEMVLKQASKIKGVSVQTELRLRAFSFGLMQVMGQTARERGFDKTFLTDLCKPWLGVEYGCRILNIKLRKYEVLSMAISAYNAGKPVESNQAYVNKVLRYAKDWNK